MLVRRAGLRHLLQHPWQTVLAIVGVALGVGVVTAVDLANETAAGAFRAAAKTVAGKATHQVLGGSATLTDSLYRYLRTDHGIRRIAPVVEGYVQAAGKAGETLFLIGIDPFAEAPIRSFSSRFTDGRILETLLAVPNSCLLLRPTAERVGVGRGGELDVEANGKRKRVTVAGYLDAGDEVTRLGLDSVLVSDIATAQELLGMEGRLSRIDVVAPEGAAGDAFLANIRRLLPPGVAIAPAGSRAGAMDRMTRAFRLNLTALSLLALVVGMFLIYNATTFSVIRRRRFMGLLRAIGVTRREIVVLVMGEALVVGIVGTAGGLLFGIALGGELTRLVTRTINDLYFFVQAQTVQLPPQTLAKAAILGIGATLAATVPAVIEATGVPPRAALSRSDIEARRLKMLPRAIAAGVLIIAGGGALLAVEAGGIIGSFAGLFGLIIGYSLLVPAAMIALSRLLRPLMGTLLGVVGKMAARGVVVSLSRTGVATAALVVAVSATIGVGIMVGSFRMTVQHWLETWLQADIYVTTAGTGSGRGKPPLDPDLVERVLRVPGAAAVSMTRRVTIESAEGPQDLLVMQQLRRTFAAYRFKEGVPEKAWATFETGEAVLVSEPFAYRHKVHAGDRVTLLTPRGERAFEIAGVFYDYGSDVGIIAMSRSAYLRFWNDPSLDGIGLYAKQGVPVEALAAQVRERAGTSLVRVLSNHELRSASVAIFDRTFAITGVLRLLIVAVALIGILSALMAIQVERARELAVARAVGLTPGQVWGLVCGETVLIGLIAGMLALPLGIVEAFVLIQVINRRSFGWTMELAVDPALMLQAILLSLAAALCAGAYPAWSISRTSPALALKEEE